MSFNGSRGSDGVCGGVCGGVCAGFLLLALLLDEWVERVDLDCCALPACPQQRRATAAESPTPLFMHVYMQM